VLPGGTKILDSVDLVLPGATKLEKQITNAGFCLNLTWCYQVAPKFFRLIFCKTESHKDSARREGFNSIIANNQTIPYLT
jgi:hypothetical protein